MAMYTTPHSSENTSQDINSSRSATKADIDEAHSQPGLTKSATKVAKSANKTNIHKAHRQTCLSPAT